MGHVRVGCLVGAQLLLRRQLLLQHGLALLLLVRVRVRVEG